MKRLILALVILWASGHGAWAQQVTVETAPQAQQQPAAATPGQTCAEAPKRDVVPAPGTASIARIAAKPYVAPPPSPTVLAQPITLDQALELAFCYNPNIRIATDTLQRARGVVAEARAGFNPQFNATAVYTRQQESTATFPGQDGQPGQSFVLQNASSTQATFNAVLPLDITKRLAYVEDIAEYQFQIQYLSLLNTSQALILDIKTAYYNLLRACGQLQVAQAAVNVATTRLDNTRARFEAGTVAKFDVTSAETDLANLNQQLIQAQNQVNIAQANLNRIMGVDVNIPTQIIQMTPPIQGIPVDIPAAIDTAYIKRPEIQAQKVAIELNKRNVKLQKTGYFPTLSLGALYGYALQTTGLNTRNANWQMTLTANIPIWTGGVVKARVEQAQADVQTAVDTLEQTQLAVSLDVRAASLNLEEAAKRVATTQQNVALAEEALRLANVRYEAGIAVLVEVLNAESQLTQARTNNVTATYDYATAQAQLQRATSCIPELDRLSLLVPVKALP